MPDIEADKLIDEYPEGIEATEEVWIVMLIRCSAKMAWAIRYAEEERTRIKLIWNYQEQVLQITGIKDLTCMAEVEKYSYGR